MMFYTYLSCLGALEKNEGKFLWFEDAYDPNNTFELSDDKDIAKVPQRKIENWDQLFMNIACVAELRCDPDTEYRAGCCIVRENKILSYGFTGLPQLLIEARKKLNDKPADYWKKAQRDAIRNALSFVGDASGSTVYSSRLPTLHAVGELIQRQAVRVYYYDDTVVPNEDKDKVMELATMHNIALRKWNSNKKIYTDLAWHKFGEDHTTPYGERKNNRKLIPVPTSETMIQHHSEWNDQTAFSFRNIKTRTAENREYLMEKGKEMITNFQNQQQE